MKEEDGDEREEGEDEKDREEGEEEKRETTFVSLSLWVKI